MKSLLEEIAFVARSKFVFSALILPLIIAGLFGYLFKDNQINAAKVAVIDEDNSLYSRQLINQLNASQYIDVLAVINQAVAPDHLFYNENYTGIVYLPRGLEQNRYTGKQSNIGFLVDFSIPAGSADLRAAISEVIAAENNTISMGRLKTMGLNEEQSNGLTANLSLQQRLLYNPTNDYMNLVVIGFVNIVALSLLTIHTVKIIPRLRLAGELAGEIGNPFGLLTRVLPCAITSGITLFFAMGILKWTGAFRFAGNPFEFMIPLFLYTLVSGLIGMCLGWTAENPSKAMVRGFVVVITSFLLSGIQTPTALFPVPIQQFASILPLTWHLRLTRGMGLRGGPLGYFGSEIGVYLFMIAVVVFLLALNMLKEGRNLEA